MQVGNGIRKAKQDEIEEIMELSAIRIKRLSNWTSH